jgi:hypothetical protein
MHYTYDMSIGHVTVVEKRESVAFRSPGNAESAGVAFARRQRSRR